MDPEVLNIMKIACSSLRIPAGGDKIYKDECVFSFDSPEYPTGLYVCVKTYLGFGEPFLEEFYKKTGNAVFLHIKRIRRLVKKDFDPPEKKVTKMAIGVEGGFDVGGHWKTETEEQHELVVMPGMRRVPFPSEEIPDMLSVCVTKLISSDSATKLQELEALAGTWDGEQRQVSKNAENLHQIENPPKVPPSGWKCDRCDKTDNLWLNLTDGKILCGRKYFDGTGGNNHAIENYEQTSHPLAVKLGTITPDGKADVYDYQVDDLVMDPSLAKHLAHFGINIHNMEKTEKTMAELEIEANQKMEWSLITESGADLKPVYGPGYTGLQNLGNSCYLGSVMQVLFSVPQFQSTYVEPAPGIFASSGGDPLNDFNVQMAKLGAGLCSGRYSKPRSEMFEREAIPGNGGDNSMEDMKWQMGIPPRSFKALIGKGHPEFSTKLQQDASEFVLHLINLVDRNSRASGGNPTELFKFKVEDRVRCEASGKVSYKYRSEYLLPLPVPMAAAQNLDEVAAYEAKKADADARKIYLAPTEVVRPIIAVDDCLTSLVTMERVDRFYSSAIDGYTTAQKTTRLATFPKYLFIQLKKFSLAPDWTPMKLDVSIPMPDELSLECIRGYGLQPGEEKLPELKSKPKVELNRADVEQLAGMGFPMEACKKAVYHTKNSGVEAAMNWIMEHMSDDDFSQPFVVPGTEAARDEFVPNEDAMVMLTSMGFTTDQAKLALKSTSNNVERAADWIFSHQHELDALVAADKGQAVGRPAVSEPHYDDGPPRYKLKAFISHMGTSAFVGHYVCHILKEGRWVIYNDEKVAMSENPPKDLGYLYLYERKE